MNDNIHELIQLLNWNVPLELQEEVYHKLLEIKDEESICYKRLTRMATRY